MYADRGGRHHVRLGARPSSHAIEAATGKLIWSNEGFDGGKRRRRAAGTSRGVSYWKDGAEEADLRAGP